MTSEIELLGERPAGGRSQDDPLVVLAAEGCRWLGYEPDFQAASTDMNIPVSMDIPAVCIGTSKGERGHTDPRAHPHRAVQGWAGPGDAPLPRRDVVGRDRAREVLALPGTVKDDQRTGSPSAVRRSTGWRTDADRDCRDFATWYSDDSATQ